VAEDGLEAALAAGDRSLDFSQTLNHAKRLHEQLISDVGVFDFLVFPLKFVYAYYVDGSLHFLFFSFQAQHSIY
jgi:hypothetical protein